MPKDRNAQPAAKDSNSPVTSNSRNELIPIIKKKDLLLVEGRLLHQLLDVRTKFSTWIERRISDLHLKENLDYFPQKGSNKQNKNSRDNAKTDYSFPIRIAQFLAIVEDNEVSRQIRQQLVRQESSFLFNDPQSIKGLASYEHNGNKMYRYADVLNTLNYSKGGSRYKIAEKYPNDFANVDDVILVSEQYAYVMCHRRIAQNLLKDIKSRQLELPFTEKEVSHG
jgi:phage anti-repressor protein